MKATNTPAQCLAIAKAVESTIETEKLTTIFCRILTNKSQPRLTQYPRRRASKAQATSRTEVGDNVVTVKVRPSAGTVDLLTPKRCPAYGKECFLCKKKGHFKQFCQSSHQNRYQSCSSDNRKSRRDMHDVDQQEDELFQLEDYDSVNVRTVRFTTDVHTNIAFNEISGGGRLQCLLTDVQLSDNSGASSTVRIKLDTGACGNLLPFNIYNKIHPQVSIKELHRTIDKRVCLEAYNKSEIKQLGTCCLTVGHGKSAKLCHFYIVPDYCRTILGLNDIHSLSLIAINCDVTDKWSANNLRPMGSVSIVDAVEEQSDSVLSKERIVNGRFKKIFSGVGHFPIEPVDIVLSEDNEPVQKLVCRVPVAMKDKFK